MTDDPTSASMTLKHLFHLFRRPDAQLTPPYIPYLTLFADPCVALNSCHVPESEPVAAAADTGVLIATFVRVEVGLYNPACPRPTAKRCMGNTNVQWWDTRTLMGVILRIILRTLKTITRPYSLRLQRTDQC